MGGRPVSQPPIANCKVLWVSLPRVYPTQSKIIASSGPSGNCFVNINAQTTKPTHGTAMPSPASDLNTLSFWPSICRDLGCPWRSSISLPRTTESESKLYSSVDVVWVLVRPLLLVYVFRSKLWETSTKLFWRHFRRAASESRLPALFSMATASKIERTRGVFCRPLPRNEALDVHGRKSSGTLQCFRNLLSCVCHFGCRISRGRASTASHVVI